MLAISQRAATTCAAAPQVRVLPGGGSNPHPEDSASAWLYQAAMEAVYGIYHETRKFCSVSATPIGRARQSC